MTLYNLPGVRPGQPDVERRKCKLSLFPLAKAISGSGWGTVADAASSSGSGPIVGAATSSHNSRRCRQGPKRPIVSKTRKTSRRVTGARAGSLKAGRSFSGRAIATVHGALVTAPQRKKGLSVEADLFRSGAWPRPLTSAA